MYSRSLLQLASQVDSPEFFASPDDDNIPSDLNKENQPNAAEWEKNGPHEKSMISSKLSEDQTRDKANKLCYSSLINAPISDKFQDLNTGKSQACNSKILQMINPNETELSPAKREVENLTDEEAAIFLKLVKLYKN